MLPKIETPSYSLNLPSNNKKVEFRPFLVKEQKALLIAMESPEDNAMTSTTLSIVEACLFNKVDVRKLPKVDVDYLFLKLREKSVGEQIDLIVTCSDCKATQDYVFDLTKVNVDRQKEHTNKIEITNNIGLIMRLPTFEEVSDLMNNYTVENIYKTVVRCIEQIYDEESVYLTKDMQIETIEQWVDNLTQEQYDKLEDFYRTAPRIVSQIEYDCKKCGAHNKLELEGIEDFFE